MQSPSDNSETNPRMGEALQTFTRQRGIEPGSIAGLMRECEPFREICADYEECCGKLQSLELRGTAADRELHDYLELRDQLERELLRYLRGADSDRGHGKRVDQTSNE